MTINISGPVIITSDGDIATLLAKLINPSFEDKDEQLLSLMMKKAGARVMPRMQAVTRMARPVVPTPSAPQTFVQQQRYKLVPHNFPNQSQQLSPTKQLIADALYKAAGATGKGLGYAGDLGQGGAYLASQMGDVTTAGAAQSFALACKLGQAGCAYARWKLGTWGAGPKDPAGRVADTAGNVQDMAGGAGALLGESFGMPAQLVQGAAAVVKQGAQGYKSGQPQSRLGKYDASQDASDAYEGYGAAQKIAQWGGY